MQVDLHTADVDQASTILASFLNNAFCSLSTFGKIGITFDIECVGMQPVANAGFRQPYRIQNGQWYLVLLSRLTHVRFAHSSTYGSRGKQTK